MKYGVLGNENFSEQHISNHLKTNMKNRLTIGLLLFTMSMLSCKSDPANGPVATNAENNIFTVDKDFCETMGLPMISFHLEYPKILITDSAVKGYKNYNYNAFLKWNDKEIQTEGISLGYYTPQKTNLFKGTLKATILNQVLKGYSQIFEEVTSSKIEITVFDNKEYYVLRAIGSVKNPEPDSEIVGTYLIQTLIVEPQGSNENGLLCTFIANEESDIKTYEDFANKGYISTVWKTLSFK